ncbi:hypothetical protein AX16_003005 [Volvariella volvacea WC 439]|nr:hypothetical protein AX16_003005 [Volvariella volvacea WC 439]
MVRIAAAAASLFALVGSAAAQQLQITSPNSNTWWVAQSVNVMAWNCQESPYTNFTVLIANPDPQILPAPLAIIGIQYNYDCSKEITQQQSAQPAASGYTLIFADPFNSTNVFATSEPFEIRPLGSQYPSQVPQANESAITSGDNAQPTGGNGNGTSSGSNNDNAAAGLNIKAAFGISLAAVGAAIGLMA